MTNTKQLAREMLEKKFSKLRGLRPHLDFTELLNNLDQIIDMTIAEERERIIEVIRNQPNASLHELQNEKVICEYDVINSITDTNK